MKKFSRSIEFVTETYRKIRKFTTLLHDRVKLDEEEEHGSWHDGWDNDVYDLPTVPTSIVPLYKNRMVLLKIGTSFLKVGQGSCPVVSKIEVPLHLPINVSSLERAMDSRAPFKALASCKNSFDYRDFTFFADESAAITESWYRASRSFFNLKLGVARQQESGMDSAYRMEYVTCRRLAHDKHEVTYSLASIRFGQWWRLTAVGRDKYVCESLNCPGYCLTKGRTGLTLTGPLTRKERSSMTQGRWDEDRTLTIIPLPDFAVRKPGVRVT